MLLQSEIFSLKSNNNPLKIDGWEMNILFKMVPFYGAFLNFQGGGGGYIYLSKGPNEMDDSVGVSLNA